MSDSTVEYTKYMIDAIEVVEVLYNIGKLRGPTEGACSMAIPAMSTRPRNSALRMPSGHPAIRNANLM